MWRWVCVAAAVACARKREPAPTEMVDLVRYMIRNWEDDALMVDATTNLASFVRAEIDSEAAQEGWQLDPLTTDDVADLEFPDHSFEGLIGAAAAARSAFDVDAHVAEFDRADQVWTNPAQFEIYDRAIVEGSGRDFEQRSGLLRTVNDIETRALGIHIPYRLDKDFKWVDGDDGDDVIARSWIPVRGCNDGESSCVELAFSLDVWLGDGGDTLRFTSSWSEVTTFVDLGEDLLTAQLASGIHAVFESTDEFLADAP
jgi:hypothetical protein